MDQLHSCPDMEEHVLAGVGMVPKETQDPCCKGPF